MLDTILEIVNSEDLATESMTFILENDIAEEVVDELVREIPLFYEDTMRDVLNVLDENAFVTVSINRYDDGEEELFVEPLIHDNGKQFANESDLFFIQEELLDVVEGDKLLGDTYVIYYEDEEECEDLDEDTEDFLEDMSIEILEGLMEMDEDDCEVCYVQDVLKELYDIAYNDAVIDMEEAGVLK